MHMKSPSLLVQSYTFRPQLAKRNQKSGERNRFLDGLKNSQLENKTKSKLHGALARYSCESCPSKPSLSQRSPLAPVKSSPPTSVQSLSTHGLIGSVHKPPIRAQKTRVVRRWWFHLIHFAEFRFFIYCGPNLGNAGIRVSCPERSEISYARSHVFPGSAAT